MKRILDGLGRADAYPHHTDRVRTVQTHISVVFLAGPFAYKVKKPVDYGFVDFSTLERRRRFCHAEVRLNRRLAPSVYHGVVPVVEGAEGLRIPEGALDQRLHAPSDEPDPEVVEWAVRMERLPEDRTLKSLFRTGELAGDGAVAFLGRLARLLARFHARAARGEEISRVGGFPSVARNTRENFDELEDAVGVTLDEGVLHRLRRHSEAALVRLRPLMEERQRRNVPCDTHGDLRLGHVYHLDDGSPDGRVLVVDCIEFNDRFRYADPVADIAFLAMELEFHDRPDLARSFTASYLDAADDAEGEELLPFYVAYRDVVRGKVRSLTAADEDIPGPERKRARSRATRHLLRALGRLAPPDERPALLLVAGLPGVGKSVLARALSEDAGFTWIDTDRVRKELAGEAGEARGGADAADGGTRSAAAFSEGIYTDRWTERTYGECLRQARALLFEGKRVAVEGSFRAEDRRRAFLRAAGELGVPALVLLCRTDREVARRRLDARSTEGAADEPSDADWRIYREMEERWEPPGPETEKACHPVPTDAPLHQALARAREILRTEGLSS